MNAPAPAAAASRTRRLVRFLIGLVVSGLFVGLAIWSLSSRGVTFGGVMDRLSGGNYALVSIYVLILIVLALLRIWRWGVMLRGIGDVGWRKVASVSLLGQAAIGLFPMRLGEAVRPILIVEQDQVNFGEATATVVVERVVDGILLGALFAATLWALADTTLPPEFRVGAYATTGLFGGLALFLVIGSIFHYHVLRLVRAVLGPFAPGLAERLVKLIESFLLALRTIVKDRKRIAIFMAVTGLMWVITGFSLVPIFAAFGIELPLVASFTVICVMVVGYMIPAGPAATGTLNYAIVLALSAFGVDESVTGALAILLYVLILVVNVAAGLVGLWLGPRRLSAVLTQELPAVSEAATSEPS